MQLDKRKPVRSRKLLDAAENARCIRCGCQDGTVVAAHYQGFGSNRLGKGRGQKPDDTATAELCRNCHEYFDSYESGNDEERAAEFLLLVLETINRRWHRGDFGRAA